MSSPRQPGTPSDLRALLGPLPEPRKPWSAGTWVALGCGGVVLACIAFVLGVGALTLGAVQRSGAYQAALARVREDPAVVRALGEPVEAGWWVTGSVNVNGPSGSASLSFPVSGPRGRAVAYVEALKRAGEWELRLLQVRLAGSGERLDLLDPEGASPPSGEAPGASGASSAILDSWTSASGSSATPATAATSGP